LTVNVGLESAVVLLDPADVLNLEALDPDQIARDPLGGRSLYTEIAIQQSAADLVDQGGREPRR
jgi:hypothetical protein